MTSAFLDTVKSEFDSFNKLQNRFVRALGLKGISGLLMDRRTSSHALSHRQTHISTNGQTNSSDYNRLVDIFLFSQQQYIRTVYYVVQISCVDKSLSIGMSPCK